MLGAPEEQPAQQVPRANPFDVSLTYAMTMRLALGMALLPGFGTGLVLVMIAGFSLPVTIGWPQLAQAHGQVQTLGFVLLFILAVALQLFPRFLAAPLRHADRAAWGAALVAAALLMRLAAQPLQPDGLRAAGLIASTAALPVGVVVAGSAFHGISRRSVQPATGPSAAWRRFVAVGGVALGAALILYVWSGVRLAGGDIVVGLGLDEALIHLELAGFATCIVFAVASRVFGRFLLLRTRPALETRLPLLAAGWGVGLMGTTASWLFESGWGAWLRWGCSAIELGVLLTWLWLTGLYDRPSRVSGTPHVTNPTRRWVRVAFGFLMVGLVLDTGLYAREAVQGIPASVVQLSAARHAIAQGFLLPLMVSMAARLLPVLSADVLKHPARLEITIDLLMAGAVVRVLAELIGGYGPVGGPLVALGGALSVGAFALFAVLMWSSLSRLPRSNRPRVRRTTGVRP